MKNRIPNVRIPNVRMPFIDQGYKVYTFLYIRFFSLLGSCWEIQRTFIDDFPLSLLRRFCKIWNTHVMHFSSVYTDSKTKSIFYKCKAPLLFGEKIFSRRARKLLLNFSCPYLHMDLWRIRLGHYQHLFLFWTIFGQVHSSPAIVLAKNNARKARGAQQ